MLDEDNNMTDLFRALKIEKSEEGQNLNIVEISEDDLWKGMLLLMLPTLP